MGSARVGTLHADVRVVHSGRPAGEFHDRDRWMPGMYASLILLGVLGVAYTPHWYQQSHSRHAFPARP
jgi:hypothetical protein